jgi:hypothetical protein
MFKNIVFLIVLLASLPGYGQQEMLFPGTDSKTRFDSIEKLQINRVNNLYLQRTGFDREFVDGKDYVPYYYRSRSTPLLRSDEDRSASLTIQGRTYAPLVLQYDTHTDEVIYTEDSLIFNNRVYQVSLNKNKISRFDLCFRHDTLHFSYFGKDRHTNFNLEDGFYEVAYENKTQYLIRHVSLVYHTMDKIEEYFVQPVNYINVGHGFSKITTTKQFIELFGKQSDDIRHFLQEKKIRIRKADKKQITNVLKYYEALPSRDD